MRQALSAALKQEIDADPMAQVWWAWIERRLEARRVEKTMADIRRVNGCSTSRAVALTAERLGCSQRAVWRALHIARKKTVVVSVVCVKNRRKS